MTDNRFSQGDMASEIRNADTTFETADTPSQLEAAARPAFNFDDRQAGEIATAGSAQGGSTSALKDKALSRLQTEADNRKGVVSDQLKQVSTALGAIGDNGQGGETPQWLSNGVGQVTQFIDKVADNVESRNSAELVEDVRSFARANPAVFLGAAALAGFVAVRIFAAAGDGR